MSQHNLSFAAQIEAWAHQVEGAAEAVFRTASKNVIAEMQTPGPSKATAKKAVAGAVGLSGKGKKADRVGPIPNPGGPGHLPVDTGFLRASIQVSLDEMPVLLLEAKPFPGQTYQFDPTSIDFVIAGAKLGQTIYAGYTAEYALYVHYGYGYLWVPLAAQNWQRHVDAAAAEVKSQLGLS